MIRRERSVSNLRDAAVAEPQLIGTDATRVLAGVGGVSAVEIESQHGDRVVLSYECAEKRQNFSLIDAALQSEGLHRLQ